MKILRPLIILSVLVLLVAGLTLWWNQPARVDMAAYAPADSLAYVEINSVSDIAKAIQQTDTWKAVAPIIGINSRPENSWATIASRAGLAPVQAVVASRAQMALVVVGINTAETADSVRVKPEVALIVETHTSKWRTKSAAVNAIKQISDFAYGDSVCTERT